MKAVKIKIEKLKMKNFLKEKFTRFGNPVG